MKKVFQKLVVVLGVVFAGLVDAMAAMTNDAASIAAAVTDQVETALDKGVAIWLILFGVMLVIAIISRLTKRGAGR